MTESIENLRKALAEVRHHRAHFSTDAYNTVVATLLERIRNNRTITETKNEPVKSDEIRLVTVMFVDVVESTRLARKMDRGDWKTLISDAHSLMASIVLEAEGNVGQYLGDGMLCYFGAQHSRGDDALRAVNCALVIQQAMLDYAEQAVRKYKQATGFAVRISLSTGRVVVGLIGNEEKQELLALGPATNLASRLQSFAEPNTIVIDAQTQRRVRTHFQLDSHEPVKVKGFEEMVAYYTVLNKIENPKTEFTNNEIVGREMPFVGREREVDAIMDIWWHAQVDHEFKVVSILGEVGIGKSRLLQQLTENINQQPITQINMFADYERREMSHNLLRNLLIKRSNLTDDTPPELARERINQYVTSSWNDPDAQTVGNVLGYMYTSDQDVEAQSQTARRGHLQQRMIFSWVARWFNGMAESSPLLIVVDNVQWIDPLSIELLEFLATELHNEIGMILVAGRNDVRVNNTSYMHGITNHYSLTLSQLSDKATHDLINAVVADVERMNPAVVDSIAERSNGNPLFVREFLSILFDSGVIHEQNGRYQFNLVKYDATVSELPGGLTGVLQARLDELPQQARVMVQAASVVGQRFWSGVITEMVNVESERTLDNLVQRGIIYLNPESSFEGEREYQFRHNLYQEVAYGMLPRAKRESYHSDVTRWLVTRMAGKPEYFPMLADQFSKADQHEASLFTYLEAVQNRRARGLLDETLSLIESGLAQAPFVEREIALPITSQLWTIRAQTYNALNRFAEASAASDSALKLLAELPDNQLVNIRVTAARTLGVAYRSMGRYHEAFEALSRAHDRAPEDDAVLQCSVLGSFGSLARYRGKLSESLAYQERALGYAEKTNQSSELNGIMTQLGLIAYEKGNIADALDYFERVLDINLDRENIHFQILDLRNIGATYQTVFAYDQALSAFEKAQELEDYIHYHDSLLQAYRALTLIEVGRIDEGLDELQSAANRGHEDVYNNLQIQLVQIQGLITVQKYEEAAPLVQDLIKRTESLNPVLYGRSLMWKGQLCHGSNPEKATKYLYQALQYESEFGGQYIWMCYQALGEATTNPNLRQKHYSQSLNVLNAIGYSLSSRPTLQDAFTKSDIVRAITHEAEQVV